jgi:hypothetical protein
MDNTKLHHIKVNPATEISTHGSRTCIPLTKLSYMGLQFSILGDTLEVMTALVTLTSLLLYSFLLHIFVDWSKWEHLATLRWLCGAFLGNFLGISCVGPHITVSMGCERVQNS